MNKSLETKEIDVLVENKTSENNKFFGRSEYMTSVIFDGNDEDVGQVIKEKIKNINKKKIFNQKVKKTK